MKPPYSDMLMDHFSHPRNTGTLDETNPAVGTGTARRGDCGDVIRMQVQVADRHIVDAKFKAFGCPSAIAAGSLTSEWLKGRDVDSVSQMTDTEIAKALSLPADKLHCSALAERAAKAAVENWQRKRRDYAGRAGETRQAKRNRCPSS